MERMTRAQRAAIGPAAVKALGERRTLTRAQQERIKALKADFGKGLVSVLAPGRTNGHLYVKMDTHAGVAIWQFDRDGNYVTRYTQRALFNDNDDTDAT